jgi:hypothetical protein
MKSLLIICAIMLCACASDKEIAATWYEERAAQISRDTEYHRDNRTSLCFAVMGYGYGQTMAHVPCTPEVEKLIKK